MSNQQNYISIIRQTQRQATVMRSSVFNVVTCLYFSKIGDNKQMGSRKAKKQDKNT